LLGEAASTLGLWESLTLKVENERRNVHHFELVLGGVKGVLDEDEFGLDLVEFSGKAVAVVVVVAITFSLCDRIPIVEI